MCIASLKTSAEETIEALLNLDELLLDEEVLRKLRRICPTEEESKILNENLPRIKLLSL